MKLLKNILPLILVIALITVVDAATLTDAPAPTNAPNWTSPTGLRYYSVVYAQAFDASNQLITNTNSQLAAFSGTNVAGVTGLINGPSEPLFQLTVYSDITPVTMAYQVYNGGTDRVQLIYQSLSFNSGAPIGTIESPIPLNVVPEPSPIMLSLVAMVPVGLLLFLRRRGLQIRGRPLY